MPMGKGTYGSKVGRPKKNKGKISGTMPKSDKAKSRLKKGTGSKSSRRPGPVSKRPGYGKKKV